MRIRRPAQTGAWQTRQRLWTGCHLVVILVAAAGAVCVMAGALGAGITRASAVAAHLHAVIPQVRSPAPHR
jgi:hypothetical protein